MKKKNVKLQAIVTSERQLSSSKVKLSPCSVKSLDMKLGEWKSVSTLMALHGSRQSATFPCRFTDGESSVSILSTGDWVVHSAILDKGRTIPAPVRTKTSLLGGKLVSTLTELRDEETTKQTLQQILTLFLPLNLLMQTASLHFSKTCTLLRPSLYKTTSNTTHHIKQSLIQLRNTEVTTPLSFESEIGAVKDKLIISHVRSKSTSFHLTQLLLDLRFMSQSMSRFILWHYWLRQPIVSQSDILISEENISTTSRAENQNGGDILVVLQNVVFTQKITM